MEVGLKVTNNYKSITQKATLFESLQSVFKNNDEVCPRTFKKILNNRERVEKVN